MFGVESEIQVKQSQKQVVLDAIAFVENNLEEPISIKEVTEQFENSHWYFQRLFRSVVGLSLGNYLRLRRLTEAASHLRHSQLRVIDIAMQFDFGSQEAFARAFKQFAQMTPTEYRDNRKYVIREVQNPLTPEKIEYFWQDVQRVPSLQNLSSKVLYGSRVDFNSHFEEGSDCAVKVVAHWQKFLKEKKAIQRQTGKEIFGVALSSELEMREKKLSYIASVETSDFEQNIPGYEYLELPSGLYAAFENRGLAQKRSSLMDYVYGIWLAQSEYKRGRGYDFEVFDHRYSLNNEKSISYLYIPIEKE
jgi:AraC family transcriptional regulator